MTQSQPKANIGDIICWHEWGEFYAGKVLDIADWKVGEWLYMVEWGEAGYWPVYESEVVSVSQAA